MRDIWKMNRPALDRSSISEDEWALRSDLAAAFRLAYQFGWTESVGNHFSAVLPGGGTTFLMNPFWMLFSEIRASDLMQLDWSETDRMEKPNPPDLSGWCIHSRIHALNPAAKVVLHIHSPYATADGAGRAESLVVARAHDVRSAGHRLAAYGAVGALENQALYQRRTATEVCRLHRAAGAVFGIDGPGCAIASGRGWPLPDRATRLERIQCGAQGQRSVQCRAHCGTPRGPCRGRLGP